MLQSHITQTLDLKKRNNINKIGRQWLMVLRHSTTPQTPIVIARDRNRNQTHMPYVPCNSAYAIVRVTYQIAEENHCNWN